MITKKSLQNYYCSTCDYNTSSKKDFQKHKKTKKHKNGNKKIPNVEFSCIDCGAVYKFRSGLSRHQKKCKKAKIKSVDSTSSYN